MKEKLLNEYGWPDHFRAEDWARDCDQVLEDAEAVEEQAMEGMAGEGAPYL